MGLVAHDAIGLQAVRCLELRDRLLGGCTEGAVDGVDAQSLLQLPDAGNAW